MYICPSILSVKKEDYEVVIKKLEDINVSMLHLDVMDGIFVPNATYNASEVEKIKKQTSLIIDTHLMISDVDNKIDDYILTKSDYITFHFEASMNPSFVIDKIKKAGLKVGISIKPNTPVEVLDMYLDDIDLVLIMSVEPGFGGQKFMESSLDKIKYLDELRNKNDEYNYLIEVDGGINLNNVEMVRNAGCNVVVMGTALINSTDKKNVIDKVDSL